MSANPAWHAAWYQAQRRDSTFIERRRLAAKAWRARNHQHTLDYARMHRPGREPMQHIFAYAREHKVHRIILTDYDKLNRRIDRMLHQGDMQ